MDDKREKLSYFTVRELINELIARSLENEFAGVKRTVQVINEYLEGEGINTATVESTTMGAGKETIISSR